MARRNPLDDGETKAPFDRSKWSLAEHCEYANAQLILNDTNIHRQRKGLSPVRWVIRDGRVMIENAPVARIEAFGRDHEDGLDRAATRAGNSAQTS